MKLVEIMPEKPLTQILKMIEMSEFDTKCTENILRKPLDKNVKWKLM